MQLSDGSAFVLWMAFCAATGAAGMEGLDTAAPEEISAVAEYVRVSGEDLAWRIDTPHLVVDLSKNPGTGRSGQINTIYAKEASVLLTRDRPTSTLHLSPNAAVGENWIGINRWDPPAKYHLEQGPRRVRLEREGEMPGAPGLHVTTAYEFFATEAALLVEESIEAKQDVRVRLLRLCEWSVTDGPANPFTHVAWADANGKTAVKRRQGEEVLPLTTAWQAFISETKRFGFAAVVERLDLGETPVLRNQATHFAGLPHYFYRALIIGPGPPLVEVPRGSRYAIRYWLYCFRAEQAAQTGKLIEAFRRRR